MAFPVSPLARKVLPLVDLTNVEDTCTAADVLALCGKAASLPIAVAAVCVRPAFITQARQTLTGTPIRVATVINFPAPGFSPEEAGSNLEASALAQATRQAVEAGADEIDLVFAWKSFIAGDRVGPLQVVEAVKQVCGLARLKVILESGMYEDLAVLRAACDGVIDAGADFLKTSTTRTTPAATPEAARVLCEASRAIGKMIGVKVSGGVRTGEQARLYLDLIADIMGLNWITPEHVRIGASKLVDNLLAPQGQMSSEGY